MTNLRTTLLTPRQITDYNEGIEFIPFELFWDWSEELITISEAGTLETDLTSHQLDVVTEFRKMGIDIYGV